MRSTAKTTMLIAAAALLATAASPAWAQRHRAGAGAGRPAAPTNGGPAHGVRPVGHDEGQVGGALG